MISGEHSMRVNRNQTVGTPAAILPHNGDPFTGLKDTDAEGRTMALTSYVGGIEHGPQTGGTRPAGGTRTAPSQKRRSPVSREGSEIRVRIEDTEDTTTGLFHDGKPFTGEVVEIGADGNLISLHTYYAGVQDGPYSEWYGPDRPFKQGIMKFGMLSGVNRQWHPNGQLTLETEFDDQGRQLYRREWDENGTLTCEHVA